MASLFGCIVIMVAAATVKSVELYPFHASCNIDWLVTDAALLICGVVCTL